MTARSAILSAALGAAVLRATADVDVELTVKDTAATARKSGAVTSGIPFARGAVKEPGKLAAATNGKRVPAQFTTLAKWEDGSIRWALMDVQVDVPAGGRAELRVRAGDKSPAPSQPVRVRENKTRVTITTGPLELAIEKQKPGLFSSIKVDGKKRLAAGRTGLVLYTAEGGTVTAGAPDEVRLESAGPMRATVMLRGRFPGVHDGLLGYTVRITAFAGQKFCKVHTWLENRGVHGYEDRKTKVTPQWFSFDGLALELALAPDRELTAECEGVTARNAITVLQTCRGTGKDGQPRHGFEDFAYRITCGDLELAKGSRTDGVVTVKGASGSLTAAIRHFWQNYEKAVELDSAALKLWLWPREGQWPREFGRRGISSYARALAALQKKGLYALPGSVHKGHEILLDFSGRPPAESSAELSAPLFALASAEYYAATGAAPALFAPPDTKSGEDECDFKLAARERMVRSIVDPASASGLLHARRAGGGGFWYGWMDFGDLAAPGAGAVHLHYDWPWICVVNAMRTGDVSLLRMADEMVRHRVEVDQQWSDAESALPGLRGFQRVGGAHPHFHCNRRAYGHPDVGGTWLAGVVLYHMLTGDAKAAECAARTADALERFWKDVATSQERDLRRKLWDMQSCARSIFSCCALYDLTAERKWLDLALAIFNRGVVRKWKLYGAHLHDREQIRSQSYTRDDIKYCYSIQALCLLHNRTGDKKVLELLQAGCDREFPENFFDAPVFLADLNAYVALATDRGDYAEEAVELWIQGAPESRCPPIYLPDSSQWTRRAAMYLRTGHLLQHGFWKKGGAPFKLDGAPALHEPPPAPFPAEGQGPLVLEGEEFLLVRVQRRDLDGAGQGKAAFFDYFDGYAARKVALGNGRYELLPHVMAPHDEADAFYMTVAGERKRLLADKLKQLSTATVMTVDIAQDGIYELRIEPAELDFYIDRVEIRRMGP